MSTNKLSSCNPQLCITIYLNAKTIDLIFSKLIELNQFCYGIQYLWKGELEEDAKM